MLKLTITKQKNISVQLKKSKAAGADNISAEYVNPNVVFYLCNLFNLIMHHGYVPAQFGSGIPLIKDRLGDATKIDNYRGITLCCVISKMFEFYISSKFGTVLSSHDLQFGFKKGITNILFVPQYKRKQKS